MSNAYVTSGECNQRGNALLDSLRDNDPMFRLLFERCADAIWLFDPERQVVLDCNEAAVQLMRCKSKEQLLCMTPGELAPACQADGRCSKLVASEMNRLVQEQGSHRFEWVARRFDGTDVPLEVLITPVQCNGHELHVVFSREISERKKAEAALQDNQRLLISIADNISDAVYRTGPNQELVFVNRAYLQMFGYNALDELRAIPRENLYARAEDRRHILGVIEHFGGFRDMEVQYKRKDGTLFWGLVTSVAVRNSESGCVEYHVGSIRDITQRKEGETEIRRLNTTLEERVAMRTAELSASEERLRTLIEHAPDAIVVLDGLTGQFVTCNENAAKLYGRPREQLLKVAPWDLSPDRQPNGSCSTEAARQWIQKAVDGQAPVFEWTHKHSSGRLVPCEVRLVRLPGDGRPLIRGSIIDNTERKRREAIQQATYQISEAVHTVEDLESLYSRIHQIVQGLMPAENFYIALLDPATETISFPYYVDQRAAENPGARALGTGLTGLVLRTGKPLLLDRAMEARKRKTGDAVKFDGMGDISYIESGHQAAIWLGVPLMAGGKPFGVMAVQDYSDAHAYGEEEKRILTFVAGQTALAIGRKRSEQALRDRTERALRHRSVLLTLAQMDKADLSNAMEQICALSAATFETARVSYWSMSQDRSAITCELLYDRQAGRAVPEAKGTRLQGDKCPAYFAALRNHEPVIAHDAQTCDATRELADGYLRPLGITSMLDVPVWLEGKVIGVLCHEHIGPRREWLLEEIDFASSLATMVSLSIEAAQRARSENALRDSEQKFRTLFDSSGQGVMLHDERCFLEVNPAAVRILRYETAEQIIGRSPAQTSAPVQPCGQSALVLAQKHINDCVENGSTRFEWMAISPKGETIPLDVILTSIRVGGRQIIQAVIDDISERKKAEQALQQRHREVVTLLDSLPGYAFFKDAQHRYVMANQNFCRAVGLTSDAIVGKDDFDLFPKELAEKYRADDAALLASGRTLFVGEEEMREPGRSFYVQTTKVPVKNEQGRVVGLIGLGFDITDRKKAEEELLRTLAREKELGELKSNFVSMVSHEFRTPLGIVMSSAEILRDYLDQLAADERQHHLLSITRSVRRMAELMEEVLVLGRLDAGKMAYNPAPLDLQVLVRRITDEVYSATERRCPINLILEKSPTEVYADERLLRHILNNLLSNAVKYSEAEAPVDLTVEQHGCEAVFVVKDRGIGIPDEDRQWLFNAFQRGRNVGHRPGTGLGLVIVKRCVELHRGSIEIESKCGEGTRATVKLPICPAGE